MGFKSIDSVIADILGREIIDELEEIKQYGTSALPPGLPFGFYIKEDW